MKDLVGKDKPFFSALDKAAGLLKRKVGTGAEFMNELKGLGGVKQAEIDERKLGNILGMPKMTHEQFLAALKAHPAPAVQEKMLGAGTHKPLDEHEASDYFGMNSEFRDDELDPLVMDHYADLKNRYEGATYDSLIKRADELGDELRESPNSAMIRDRIYREQDLIQHQIERLSKVNPDLAEHEDMTLPGGENYREMLIKAPKNPYRMAHDELRKKMQAKYGPAGAESDRANPEDKQAWSNSVKKSFETENDIFPGVKAHFRGEPGILASMRLKDRTGPNGEKLLHLEELQSDWHQRGREGGYGSQLTPDEEKQIKEYQQQSASGSMPMANRALWAQLIKKREGAVPDAPFKKNWEEMALKRLVHHAAEKGYHGIVVTPGQEQADRYNLSKHISNLSYDELGDLRAYDHDGRMVMSQNIPPDQLHEHVGKELGAKIAENHAKRLEAKKAYRTLLKSDAPNEAVDPVYKEYISHPTEYSGLDLQVGGEGMKAFYDRKVPNILNDIGKKHKVKTGKMEVETVDPNEEIHWYLYPNGNQAIEHRGELREFENEADAQKYHHQLTHKNLHHFPITEEMRADVLKNGLPLYKQGGMVHKATGGNVTPTLAQMKLALSRTNPLSIQSIGANEAPDMQPKIYFPPDTQKDGFVPPGGVKSPPNMTIGGVDTNPQQPGQQLAPPPPPATQPQPQTPGAPGGATPQPPSNILQMTPQGQMMNALTPQPQPKGLKDGGQPSVAEMKRELAKKKEKKSSDSEEKRILVKAEGAGGVKGIVVPKHLIEGNEKASAEGLKNMMKARAKIYGSEHRDPLSLKAIGDIHKQALHEHFQLPLKNQLIAEKEALNRLRAAKFIKHNRDTLDESEKLDTVHHEYDEEGRSHVGFASKGIAGRALFPKGHGKNMDYEVINVCPGQTAGCGGGVDENGIVDTKRGTCFAPNSESQYAAAASRRAGHTIAKFDPAMTRDWIIAHTGSMRDAANKADKSNERMLFRPNVVDETDTTSRHVIRHLNRQRREENKPDIISNQYGKTNELHDPENGYFVTHSNIGPKVKHGHEITENIGRDRARIRNTVFAADNKGDFKNEQGNLTPPKGSYLVTDVKRGSPMSKAMESSITHAKYWSAGREQNELSPQEKLEGLEGHFGPNNKPVTPQMAHYGHTTINGRRYDYQKQHVLHPRLVQVGYNEDGTPHMIPTDSRFKDEEFLPRNRFITKNGKRAGHILMTTPTESTDNAGHQTTFTHNVSESSIQHAKKNRGEYEIDNPLLQEQAKGKEYLPPKAIKTPKTWKLAIGGVVSYGRDPGYSDDNFHAFPEQNGIAQRHLAMRLGDDEERQSPKRKISVPFHNNMDTMRLELIRNK